MGQNSVRYDKIEDVLASTDLLALVVPTADETTGTLQ